MVWKHDRHDEQGSSPADQDAVWKHDRFDGQGKTHLVDSSAAAIALRQANAVASSSRGLDLNIKGAGAVGSNVVQIENLAKGTSAADVEVCDAFLSL